jgi:hypothetical protein
MTDYLTGQRFEVTLDFDKPDRMLRIDFNALCRAEEPCGLSFLDWNGELTGTRLKALVWASLVYEPNEKRLTYDEVGDVLNMKALDVMATITLALVESMPDPPAEGEEPEDPQKTATAPD